MAGTLVISRSKGATGARLVDGGRPGYLHQGVARGGAADPVAAAKANKLLGQHPMTPCIEIPLHGGSWSLSGDGWLVLTGADMQWSLDGVQLDRYTPIRVTGSQSLRGTFAKSGCRAYLAVAGQWLLPTVLGSVEIGVPGITTSFPAGEIRIECTSPDMPPEALSPSYPNREDMVSLTAHPGPEWNWLDDREKSQLYTPYTVHPDSNRQGIRLQADSRLDRRLPELLSSPVLPGTVQWTPSGLILLGPDAQTVGGYPRVLFVPKWTAAYQLLPGARMRFKPYGDSSS